MENAAAGNHRYVVAGKSCLAGDIFGTFHFDAPLKAGSLVRFSDAAGYTMVKKNWFNGLRMPSIVIKKLDGSYEMSRIFSYNDFKNNLGSLLRKGVRPQGGQTPTIKGVGRLGRKNPNYVARTALAGQGRLRGK